MTGNEALNRLSLTATAAGLADGRFTANDLLECCLAAIARDNGRLNAFVHIDAAGARHLASD